MCKEHEAKLKICGGDSALKDSIDLDQPVISFFVKRFVSSLMLPLLGSPDPAMWEILFKKEGAKQRVNAHMLHFALKYVASHTEYNTSDAMKRLLEADYDKDLDTEPILSAMQEELYDYLRKVEHYFM